MFVIEYWLWVRQKTNLTLAALSHLQRERERERGRESEQNKTQRPNLRNKHTPRRLEGKMVNSLEPTPTTESSALKAKTLEEYLEQTNTVTHFKAVTSFLFFYLFR